MVEAAAADAKRNLQRIKRLEEELAGKRSGAASAAGGRVSPLAPLPRLAPVEEGEGEKGGGEEEEVSWELVVLRLVLWG